MKLPPQFQCDWPECASLDTVRVVITLDAEPPARLDLCPEHREPLTVFLSLAATTAPARRATNLAGFFKDDDPDE